MSEVVPIRRPNGYIDWSKMSDEDSKTYILSEMKKYDSPTTFNKGSPAFFKVMLERGWRVELQLKRGWKPRTSWEKMDKEEGIKLMMKIASEYNNLRKFIQDRPGIAQKAQEWGVYNEVTACLSRVRSSKAMIMAMDSDDRLTIAKR